MAELLPDQHPAVLALRRIAGRQKSADQLVMLIHSSSKEANHRFADALKPELQAMVPKTFTEMNGTPTPRSPSTRGAGNGCTRRSSSSRTPRRCSIASWRGAGSRASSISRAIPRPSSRSCAAPSTRSCRRYPTPNYFEKVLDGQDYLGVMLWQRLDGLATASAHDALDRVRETVSKVDPHRFAPDMKVEYTGAIAQAIDMQNGIRDDLTLATLLCTTCVLLAIYSYFRRPALLWVIGAPAVLGLLIALFIASLTIHYLNINTSFLISIILGNGINSPIILLGRYGEERQAQKPVGQALAQAMSSSVAGIAAAVAAASIAYGSLLLTSFRGFNQFGLLGGAGMLLVGLMTFILVPPLVIFGERRWPGLFTPRPNLWRRPFAWLGELSARRPLMLGLAALVALGAAAGPLYRYAKDPLEWNFEKLRTKESPSDRLWPKMEALGMGDVGAGFIGNNGVLLVDEPSQADPVAQAMKKQDAAKGPKHVLKEVRTLSSTLPSNQAAKLETLARIRTKIDKHKSLMTEAERATTDAWRPPEYLRVLTVADLPHQIRDAFTESDGQLGRLVGIDADHATYYDWNGHDLLRISSALKVQAVGKEWVAASAATIFAGMLETIIADGPRVTLAALLGVTTLVLLSFGLRGGIPVLASIAIGIVWLGGIAGALALKLNFMNFVALPITLGVGADYAANIWARLRLEGPARIRVVIAETGSAVALCSLTTIIGYSSLLLSRNLALRSFGLLADLGEIACLLAALVALPSLVRLFSRDADAAE